MPVTAAEIHTSLIRDFPQDKIEIIDLVGDQNHYQITITSNKFKNLNKLAQHRLVMQNLREKLKEELHAVKIVTKIPS